MAEVKQILHSLGFAKVFQQQIKQFESIEAVRSGKASLTFEELHFKAIGLAG
jgi:adenine-specific DNA methylase